MSNYLSVSDGSFEIRDSLGGLIGTVNYLASESLTDVAATANAISGITLVGALLSAGAGNAWLTQFLGCAAVILATVNAVGGFLVTHRMLAMFRRKD